MLSGKMFVMLPLDGEGPVISYPAGQERFGERVELEGLIPAPYFARIFWVSAERWDVFRKSEWEEELRCAHQLVLEKLPAKVRATLELPKAELKKAVAEGQKRRAEWEAKEAVRRRARRLHGRRTCRCEGLCRSRYRERLWVSGEKQKQVPSG